MRIHRFAHAGLDFALAETGAGRTMVFQHGLCGDAAQPADVFPPLPDWRCLTLECRGHGGSEAGPPDQFTIATFADDVAAMISAHADAPVVLGGISMGAAIALRLAVTRPDLVKALVLVRPAWVTEAAPANMAPNALVGALLARFPAEAARARFEQSETARHLDAEAPDNLASLRGFFTRAPLAITAQLLTGIAADGPDVTSAEVARIAVPTLVIASGEDAIHPLQHAEALVAMIPDARLVAVTPKGFDRIRYRADIQAALTAFLQALDP